MKDKPKSQSVYFHYTNAKGFASIANPKNYGKFTIQPNWKGFVYVTPLALPAKTVIRELFAGLEWHNGKGAYVVMIHPYVTTEANFQPDNSFAGGYAYKHLGPITQGVDATFPFLGPNPF
ncbi:hypothetical protein NBRC116594_14590 [Shimia sp. NS0008-38b]